MNESYKENFIEQYLQYIGETEAPQIYHRWCAISALGAWLGRNVNLQLGHFKIYPNTYIMLMGTSGTRKSTAIKISKKLLQKAGYIYFSAEKTSKEKFLLDLGEQNTPGNNGHDILENNLWGGLNGSGGGYEFENSDKVSQIYITADEFNDFTGVGNIEFISLLGSLWDFLGPYQNKVKNSKSVIIPNPTVSILSGNTPVGFSMAFPADTLGQGFFSRLILVHGEPTGKKITFPKPPSQQSTENLLSILVRIKESCNGEMKLTGAAEKLLDKLYTEGKSVIDDIRFESYVSRRFPHLLKLILIVAAARCSIVVEEEDIIYANTILTHADYLMPRALGQFGKSKNSGLAHRLLQVMDGFDHPAAAHELWKHLLLDFDSQNQLSDMVRNMVTAGKLQAISVDGHTGFLPVRTAMQEEEIEKDGTVDFSILSKEERSMAK